MRPLLDASNSEAFAIEIVRGDRARLPAVVVWWSACQLSVERELSTSVATSWVMRELWICRQDVVQRRLPVQMACVVDVLLLETSANEVLVDAMRAIAE